MKPENNPVPFYLTAAGAAGEVGCLLVLSAGGSVVLGLLFDQLLGTKPLFIISTFACEHSVELVDDLPLHALQEPASPGFINIKKEDTASDD